MSPICARADCDNLVVPTGRPGRPPIYCSPACRPSPSRHTTTSAIVAITHDPIERGARPAGRIWRVQLQRGSSVVTLADGLGRPSADHLAREVSQLLSIPRAEGGEIE